MDRAVVLLSGGLDSATALALALEQGREAWALTIRYGQRHAVEVERAARIASRLGAREHRVVDLDLTFVGGSALTDPDLEVPVSGSAPEKSGENIPITYVPARNTVFLSLALAWAEVLEAGEVWIGVNAVDYSGYPDCRPEYIRAFEHMSGLATRAGVEGRPTRIRAPLLDWSKGRIVRRAQELGVDLGATVSCYAPDAQGRPCRRCDACVLRAQGFAEAGLPDPGLD